MTLLNIENLSKECGNLRLLNDLNLTLNHGKCIGIKCPNDTSNLLFRLILGKTNYSKGNIYIENTRISKCTNIKNIITVVLSNEGIYERLKIYDYMNFFKKIYNSKSSIKEILIKLGLFDISNKRIKTLTYSQKKRLSMARALLSNSKLILIQEPTLNVDRESALIIRECIPYICSLGISILATSVSLEDIILLGGETYILDEKGLNTVETDISTNETDEKSNNEADLDSPYFKVDKIPAKIDEKIILLNPTEIISIESLNGTSYLNVGEEKFPCTLTLNELENRLKHFGFFRCHRSYLVNLQRVREVVTWTRNSFSLILDDKNKTSIPLSKGRMNELKDILKF
ncbi:LytTR family transcriptional regulator DNA-binding domain-containing protein [Clostridium sp. JS66]|uniref:LytTR family transcriptional regulator DNA-binding domain-containing protein n=1 Tax=Clostridium sp. JS66 TaxID=3064705 RepID=UPI00298DFE1C|nr:LytTR family transcriptional regulator DNA-binding domain-containing protein [Clostridium sp. JS66]WPC43182.1 LytTR family transcriptional regulator DNA-binding domain-containing protein [Clostridium sp. JS66]